MELLDKKTKTTTKWYGCAKLNCGNNKKAELTLQAGETAWCAMCKTALVPTCAPVEEAPREAVKPPAPEVPPGTTFVPDPAAAKDTTKPQLSLLEGDFLAEMADTMAEGIRDGRSPGDWKKLDWTPATRASYMDALLRHALLDFDAAAVACNAMIIRYNDDKVGEQ